MVGENSKLSSPPLRFGVAGSGAVGRRVVEQLLAVPDTEVVLYQHKPFASPLVEAHGDRVRPGGTTPRAGQGVDCLVIATPRETQHGLAQSALRASMAVVSTADTIADVRALRSLDPEASALGLPVLVGCGFAPGLTCVLARYASRGLDRVDEIHVAKHGTGGPACARAHHQALKNPAIDWRNGGWSRRPGGSGRELVWFPEPVEGADCYRAALPDSLLLHDVFPEASRVTARVAATRQDRFTAWLPMLSPPHAEGAVGAVRVEVRGLRADSHVVEVLGAVARPAAGTASVAALAAQELMAGTWSDVATTGVQSLGHVVAPGAFLSSLRDRGLCAWEFEGLTSAH